MSSRVVKYRQQYFLFCDRFKKTGNKSTWSTSEISELKLQKKIGPVGKTLKPRKRILFFRLCFKLKNFDKH